MSYEDRWGEALPGAHAMPHMTNEAIIARIKRPTPPRTPGRRSGTDKCVAVGILILQPSANAKALKGMRSKGFSNSRRHLP
jgi:hypothetical protein